MVKPPEKFTLDVVRVIAHEAMPYIFGGAIGWHIPAPKYVGAVCSWLKAKLFKRDGLAQALTTPKVKQ